MIGCYISDDYYFWINADTLLSLVSSPNTFCSYEAFVCPKKNADGFIRMDLEIRADHEREFSDFQIKIDYKKKICTLVFTLQNLEEWFVSPTLHVLENGPSIRFGSANVYLKTEKSKDPVFRDTIIGHLRAVPEKPRPNRRMIQKLKSRENKRKK